MTIINDIELIMPLRALGLIKNGFFGISQLYLTENYFKGTEVIGIKELEENGGLIIFDLSHEFYDFFNKNYVETPELAITDFSSIYYAQKYGLSVLSRCKHVKKFAIAKNVKICEPIEVLEKLNAEPEKINILEQIISTVMTN